MTKLNKKLVIWFKSLQESREVIYYPMLRVQMQIKEEHLQSNVKAPGAGLAALVRLMFRNSCF